MAGNDTAALVVALSAKLDKFERDMAQAGGIADRTASGIEDRFSRLNPTFAGSFLGTFLSNLPTRALDAAIKLVTDLKDRFIDLDATAHLVGLTLNEAFGFQEAAAKAKVPVDDVNKSVRGLAELLDQMQRGEQNSLSKLLDFNPTALQGINREALTLQQTFGIVANLVQNADNNLQKIDVLRAAGQAETMVKFLEKGGDAVRRLANDAAAAAPELQKLADQAKAFDQAWADAVKNVKAYLSDNLFGAIKTDLQDVIALLGGAVSFLNLFKGGLVDGAASRAAGEIEQLRQVLVRFQQSKTQIDESAGLNTASDARADRRGGSGRATGGSSTRDASRPITNIPPRTDPSGTDAADAFDRTEEQITRHTATINADTIAVSQNNAVQAQLRAEFQLLNAIRKEDGEVTQQQIDRYTTLRATMSAQNALTAAGIQLTSEHARSFISASEGARQAVTNYDAARESVSRLNSASSQLGSALSSAFADAVVEGKSLNDVMGSLIKTLEKAAINSAFASIFNAPAAGGLSPFASGLRGIFGFSSGGYTGAVGRGEPAGIVHGQEFVVNAAATSRNRGLLEAINNGLPGFQAGGFVGMPSIPTAINSNSSGNVAISVINNAPGVEVQTTEVADGRGGRNIQFTIDGMMAANMARPGSATRGALRNNFGATPAGVRR